MEEGEREREKKEREREAEERRKMPDCHLPTAAGAGEATGAARAIGAAGAGGGCPGCRGYRGRRGRRGWRGWWGWWVRRRHIDKRRLERHRPSSISFDRGVEADTLAPCCLMADESIFDQL